MASSEIMRDRAPAAAAPAYVREVQESVRAICAATMHAPPEVRAAALEAFARAVEAGVRPAAAAGPARHD